MCQLRFIFWGMWTCSALGLMAIPHKLHSSSSLKKRQVPTRGDAHRLTDTSAGTIPQDGPLLRSVWGSPAGGHHLCLMYASSMPHVCLMYASCMPHVCLMYVYKFPPANDICRCSSATSCFVGPSCHTIMPRKQESVREPTGACRNKVFQTLGGGVDKAYMRGT